MIPYYIVYILLGIVGFIMQPLTLLPDVVLPSAIATSLATAGTYLGVVDSVIPYTLGALFVAFASMIGIELAIFAYKFIRWVYQKIPGVN
jgi:hypothetical protein